MKECVNCMISFFFPSACGMNKPIQLPNDITQQAVLRHRHSFPLFNWNTLKPEWVPTHVATGKYMTPWLLCGFLAVGTSPGHRRPS